MHSSSVNKSFSLNALSTSHFSCHFYLSGLLIMGDGGIMMGSGLTYQSDGYFDGSKAEGGWSTAKCHGNLIQSGSYSGTRSISQKMTMGEGL